MSSPPSLLPILIVPGFMSSGLEVRQSSLQKSWVGKRLFINLISLGFEAVNFVKRSPKVMEKIESAQEDDGNNVVTEEIRQHMMYKNLWIQHMALNLDDLCSEPPGIEVRPMKGLSAVDYLAPGSLTDHVSYVFGPLIKALQDVGYKEQLTLDAAPYDWRLPPSVLERRDGYFSSTMKTIEDMYEKNNNTPIILVCHSMGCKVAHYLLNFANERCEGWTDKYIHTYMPVGGPHLGAPKALRASITGDSMGLSAFLNDSESLVLGRSFGSAPWLIPGQLPDQTLPNVFLHREGAFVVTIKSKIINMDELFESRETSSRPKKLRLILKLGTETIKSEFFSVEGTTVEFNCRFTFSSGPDGPTTKRCCSCCCRCCCNTACCRRCLCCDQEGLVVHLCEPGLQAAKKKRQGEKQPDCCSDCCSDGTCDVPIWLKVISCYYIIRYVLQWVFYQLWLYLAEGINRAADGSSILASSDPIFMDDFVGADGGMDTETELLQTECCMCHHKRGTVKLGLNIRWVSPEPFQNESSQSLIAEQMKSNCRVLEGMSSPRKEGNCCSEDEAPCIQPTSGYNLLKKEGNEAIISAIENMYAADSLEPRGYLSSQAPPPVKRIKAIYGINLPTECGAIYKRRGVVAENENKITNMYILDSKAQLEGGNDTGDYLLEGGILKETSSTPQMIMDSGSLTESSATKDIKKCSGDGTVPYWSLQHVRTWEKACTVSISELKGAEHRAILADSRFHVILIDYMINAMEKYKENAENNV